jgi:tetratricopeptide (TPR) repeat protein
MIEPRRSDLEPAADSSRRDSQTEALLIDGLDRYFAGRYDEAIHLWTRVLFLDRTHARARAYIDRARTAVAERQRRTDELLQESRDLLERGDTTAARTLLSEAVAAAGEDDQAAALRLQLERAERVRTADPGRVAAAVPRTPVEPWRWPRRQKTVVAALAIVALTTMLIVAIGSPLLRDVALGRQGPPLGPGPAAVQLPVLSSADVALVRARTLFARGRLAEALVALDRIGPDSPSRPAADQLRTQIQEVLLVIGRPPDQPGSTAGAVRR